MSFVWPDQPGRFDRLRAAIDIASKNPDEVDPADAGEWVGRQLADGPAAGAVTVVFHSIVWQYLPRPTRDALRDALRRAGEMAHAMAPVVWLRMEPAGPGAGHAELRATEFPSGHDEVLAEVGFHGADIRWLAGTG